MVRIGQAVFRLKGPFADGLHIESESGSLPLFLMGEAGMGFRQILALLTTAPAERFGVGLGRIAPGLIANIVILDKDPSKDVRVFAAVAMRSATGVIYEAKATRSPHLRSLRCLPKVMRRTCGTPDCGLE